MARGVNPAVKGVEAAGPDALVHRGLGQPGGAELGGRNHPVLPSCDGRDPRIHPGWTTFLNSWFRFVSHPPIVAGNALRVWR